MRLGLIVECGPAGAETQVLPMLAKRINPGAVIHDTDVIPLGKKPLLLADCGIWSAELLHRGCDRVIIVWDLLPDWGEFNGKGCLHVDREKVFNALTASKADKRRIRLVCIRAMLEAWLLSDERAIQAVLSTSEHPVAITRVKKTENEKDPKSALNTIFEQSTSRKARMYVDYTHAAMLVKRLPDLTRLDKCQTFQRFTGFVI